MRSRSGVFALSSILLVAVVGCGGSKKSSPPAPATYTVGGTVTGLTGAGLVLQNNGGSNLTVSAKATTFTIATAVQSGSPYSVTVLTQPAGQNCTVSNGSGTSSANVTSVRVTCVQAYTIGGSVLGLSGTGLVLQDNGGNNLAVSSNATSYAFTFNGPIPEGGAPYTITVLSNSAGQACTVANPNGTATSDVTNVNLSCTSVAASSYTIGGAIMGLTGPGLVLQLDLGINNQDLLTADANGSFTFALPAAKGGAYHVSVLTEPTGRNCAVANGAGTVTGNVTDVTVSCLGEWTWMGGSSTVGNGRPGIYGELGKSDSANIPGGRKLAITWSDSSGNGWLFGGEGYDSVGTGAELNDLWKFDPKVGDHGQWTWMSGSSVASYSTTNGPNGQPGVYGTLGTPSPRNVPGGREASATWLDSSGNFWLFGGGGIDSVGNSGDLNDLWKFDRTLGDRGEWTWMGGSNTGNDPNEVADKSAVYGTLGVAAPNNIPGKRNTAVSWLDSSGNFWLFGGFGFDSTGYAGNLNDLWRYTPGQNGSAGEWAWMGGKSDAFGSSQCQSPDDIVYGKKGQTDPANFPGGRNGAVTWVDSSGNVWLFGGYGCDSTGASGYLNDLWKYTPGENGEAGQWTWMSGSNTLTAFYGPSGVYGSQGLPAPTNVPGGRVHPVSWVDSSGDFWLFGGNGVDSNEVVGQLNDLWRYTPGANGALGEWTWIDGNTSVGPYNGQSGSCGTLGLTAATNAPGGRDGATGWHDSSGNLWLLGGQGFDCGVDTGGYMNDVWKFQP